MKKVFLLIVVFLLIIGMGGCSETNNGISSEQDSVAIDTKIDSDTIVIGTIMPITSPNGIEATRGIQGMQLAVNEINTAGGVLDKKLVLKIEDDGNLTETSVSLMRKFGEDKEIKGVIGPHFTVNLLACSPVIEEFTIPTISGSTGVDTYALKNPYFFRCRPSDKLLASSLANIATDNLGCEKLAILYLNNSYGEGAYQTIKETLNVKGIDLVLAEGHSTNETDYTASLLKCEKAGADAVIVYTYNAQSAIICRQFKQLGLNNSMIMLGGPSFCSQPLYDALDAEYVDGTYTVSDFVLSDPDKNVQKFVSVFSDAYGVNPELIGTAYYNAIYIYADAITRAGSTERQAIADALTKTNGVLGNREFYCDENNDMCHHILIVKNEGKTPTIVGTIDGN